MIETSPCFAPEPLVINPNFTLRDMSLANPLWGAPGIHGGLLKLVFKSMMDY